MFAPALHFAQETQGFNMILVEFGFGSHVTVLIFFLDELTTFAIRDWEGGDNLHCLVAMYLLTKNLYYRYHMMMIHLPL